MTHDDDECAWWVKRQYVGYGAGHVGHLDVWGWPVERREVFIKID
jgi:hypothetical protein